MHWCIDERKVSESAFWVLFVWVQFVWEISLNLLPSSWSSSDLDGSINRVLELTSWANSPTAWQPSRQYLHRGLYWPMPLLSNSIIVQQAMRSILKRSTQLSHSNDDHEIRFVNKVGFQWSLLNGSYWVAFSEYHSASSNQWVAPDE